MRRVDRDAGALHPGGSGHVPAAQQCLPEPGRAGPDWPAHPLEQRLEHVDVGLAVVQDPAPLAAGPRAAAHDQVAVFVFLVRGDGRDPVVGEGTKQATAPRAAVEPVGLVAELGVQVEQPGGHRPAQRQEAANLGAGVVGDEQRLVVYGERRTAGSSSCQSRMQPPRSPSSRATMHTGTGDMQPGPR